MGAAARLSPFERQAQETGEVKPRTTYGPAFIVMEDGQKNTFIYDASKWVPHAMSMAEVRVTCQVKELPKIKDKARYEVREPLA